MDSKEENRVIDMVHEIVVDNAERLSSLTEDEFMTYISVTMKHYCVAHDLNVAEMAQTVSIVTAFVDMSMRP